MSARTDLLAKLTADLIAARAVAEKAIKGMEDGGTCNFDALRMYVGKGTTFARSGADIEAAIKKAGCNSWIVNSYGKSYVINLCLGGQAAVRTRAVEAARAHMKAAGWGDDLGCYYAMD